VRYARAARRCALALIGAGICAALLAQQGWSAIREALLAAGPWFAVVAVIDVAALACDGLAIRNFARGEAGWARAISAQLCGFAVNRLTPGSSLGEPIKVSILMGEASREASVAAILLYNLSQFGAGVVVAALGAPIALAALELTPTSAALVWGAVALVLGGLVGLIALLRRGLIGGSIGLARRARLISAARAGRWRASTAPIDAQLSGLHDRRLWRGLAWIGASWALERGGTLVLLGALGTPVFGGLALAVISIGVLIGWLASLMPLGLGIADGGHYTLYAMFGASPALGVAFAMVIRARACVAAVVAVVLGGAVMAGRRAAIGEAPRTLGALVTPAAVPRIASVGSILQ
jgi:hypothetical protein